MASELIVQTLKGPTSGANANKVIIPSGQTLDIDAWSPPAGTVLQVVEANMSGDGIFSTTSTSFVDVGLSATITPSSTSSKILIAMNAGGVSRPGVSSECPRLKILRDTTKIYGEFNIFYTTDSLEYSGVSTSFDLMDQPSTTSAVTYKVQMRTRLGNSCSMNAGDAGGSTDQYATMTLMEIAG